MNKLERCAMAGELASRDVTPRGRQELTWEDFGPDEQSEMRQKARAILKEFCDVTEASADVMEIAVDRASSPGPHMSRNKGRAAVKAYVHHVLRGGE